MSIVECLHAHLLKKKEKQENNPDRNDQSQQNKDEPGKQKSENEESLRTPQEIADMTVDLKAISSADFRSKYGITKEDFKKEIGIK